MARLLLRLRLRLLGNTLQRGTQAAIGLLVGALVGLVTSLAVASGLAAAADARVWPDVVTTVYGAVWIGWLVFPAMTFASDDTLDPRRFSLLGLRPHELVPGLLLGALASVGPVATLVGVAGAPLGAVRTGSLLAGVVAAVAAGLVVVVSVACSRAVLALLSDLLASRRGRDVAGLLGMVVALAIVLGAQAMDALQSTLDDGDVLATAADVAAWTPGGQAGLAVGAAVDGDVAAALVHLGVVVAVTILALVLWGWAIARTSATAPTRTTGGGAHAQLYPRLLAWWPRTRTTAVAVRFLRMLARDGRVRTQALSQAFIVVPMIALSISSLQGASAPLFAAYLVVPFGLLAANQLGLDGPALWQHELAGEAPADDLRGRALALGTLALPTSATAAVVLAALFDGWALLPAALLLCLATLLTLLGVSNAAAVLAPYPVPEQASNVFGSSSSGAGCLQALLAVVVLAVQGVLLLPAVLPVVLLGSPTARAIAAAFGVAYGGGLLIVGTLVGARRARGRGPELLQAVDPRRA